MQNIEYQFDFVLAQLNSIIATRDHCYDGISHTWQTVTQLVSNFQRCWSKLSSISRRTSSIGPSLCIERSSDTKREAR